MPPTDTSEKGLETLIFQAMTGRSGLEPVPDAWQEVSPTAAGGTGWLASWPRDYDRTHALDTAQLLAFLQATQPEELKKLGIANFSNKSDITLLKFLARLESEIGKRGAIDVLRSGIKHGALTFELFYGTPSPGNAKAAALHAVNRFSVTRQLRYSLDETRRALDLCLFINGLPIATFELKNSLTKQTVEDAVEQYRRDRDPREKLFELGRCVVHFAVDEQEVMFCTQLKGKACWFLPFNQGWNDGAGNPPNPDGLKTDYLWKRILTPRGLTDILENYAQIIDTRNEKTGRKKAVQVFPRFHQLTVVRLLLADVSKNGVGKRYLIQNSAGSGKSNSIAWLAHQLIGLRQADRDIFDSIIVITDRRILDQQIQATIKKFAQVSETVGHAKHSGDLRKFIEAGKKIIISTVQKLPAPIEEDLAKGILEAIDMDSYRAEKKAALKIILPDANAEIEPVPTMGGGRKAEPELDRLSNILKMFNDHFGTLFTDADHVFQRIKDDVAPKVAADRAYQNAKQNTPNTARIEHDKALTRVMLSLLKDDTETYKQFVQNELFKRFVTDMVFEITNV